MSQELILVTPPAVEPISVDEFKAFVRFDHSEEDALIEELITAARDAAERYTRRSFITTTWRLRVGYLNGNSIVRLHRTPVIAVASVTYVDANGITQTVDADTYGFEPNGYLVRSLAWPSRTSAIEFTAGYGASPDDVPAGIRTALKLYASHLWETRKPGGESDMPEFVRTMLSRYRAL